MQVKFTVNMPDLRSALFGWAISTKRAALENFREVTHGTASEVLARAQESVPVATGELKASGHLIGPFVDGASVVSAAGYTAEYAPAEHEGFHYGLRKGPGPRWLYRALKAQDTGAFQQRIYLAVYAALKA